MINPKFIKVPNALLVLSIWVFASAIGIHFRLYPLSHYTTPDSYEKATLLIVNNIKRAALEKTERQHPQAPALQKKKLAMAEFSQMMQSNREKMKTVVFRAARQMDQELGRHGAPYLLEGDPFYFYQLTENIQETGKIGKIKGSKYFNELMTAPTGAWCPVTLHPYVGYFIYQVVKFFDPQATLMFGVSFTSLFLFVLSLLPFIFTCRYIFGCSGYSILVGAIVLTLSDAYIHRSLFGWYDNDPYNALFPFLALYTLFQGFSYRDQKKKLFLFAGLTSLFITAYSLFWQGWVFFESIVILSGILIVLYNHFWLKARQYTTTLIIYYGIIFGGTLVGTALIFGPKEFFVLFQEGWKALTEFIAHKLTLWPDMYLAVGELRSTSFSELMEMTINPIFFWIALFGFFSRARRLFIRPSTKDIERYHDHILIVYFVIVSAMTFKAQRFSFLYLVPFSFLLVLGCEQILSWIRPRLSKIGVKDQFSPVVFPLICVILVSIVIFVSIGNAAVRTPRLITVFYNDTWEKVMKDIREQTPENSIINSWWPAGHFIKAMGHRRVVFDGATINQPQAYWMAKALLHNSERSSLGIIRMINGNPNEAIEYLQKIRPLHGAIQILNVTAGRNMTRASLRLRDCLKPKDIPKLLSSMHVSVPPSYLLIHNELVEKNILVNFIGHWDFKKAEELHAHAPIGGDLLAPVSSSYIKRLWALSGGQPRYSGLLSLVVKEGSKLVFKQNVTIDLEGKTCSINSPLYGKGVPRSLFFLDGDEYVEKEFSDANLTYSVALIERANGYYCVLLERDMAKSMLVRLFFFGGKGLNYIEPFTQAYDSTRRTEIYVYRINWEKFIAEADQ